MPPKQHSRKLSFSCRHSSCNSPRFTSQKARYRHEHTLYHSCYDRSVCPCCSDSRLRIWTCPFCMIYSTTRRDNLKQHQRHCSRHKIADSMTSSVFDFPIIPIATRIFGLPTFYPLDTSNNSFSYDPTFSSFHPFSYSSLYFRV